LIQSKNTLSALALQDQLGERAIVGGEWWIIEIGAID
jgi:hypothetical protein